jgi:pyruvate,water dikinase
MRPSDGGAEAAATRAQRYVRGLADVRAGDLPRAGGKGANLGELAAAGFAVPEGFCVLTDAYRSFVASADGAADHIAALGTIPVEDAVAVRAAAAALRGVLERAPIPAEVEAAIGAAWRGLGADGSYAVRSSATAEDLPGASFAGQQDSYLNVVGHGALLDAVRRCWASLFTERAVRYRARNGFDHAQVALAVVVQRMLRPEVSGILFTADPVGGRRGVAVVDAGFGLGEALVSGVVSADRYRVDRRTRLVLERSIADKGLRIDADPSGGVVRTALVGAARSESSLSDARLLELVALGDRVEAHFGAPQDIEWSVEDGVVRVLQARPITSLYPLPVPTPSEDAPHLYFSFGHAQGLTDPMSELARSVWRILLPFGRLPGSDDNPRIAEAGGRLFLDVSSLLRHPLTRRMLLASLGNADPLAPAALRRLSARPAFRRGRDRATWGTVRRWFLPLVASTLGRLAWRKPEGAPEALARDIDAYLDEVRVRLDGAAGGPERLRVARAVLGETFLAAAWPLPPYVAAGILGYHLLRRWAPAGMEQEVAAVARGLRGNVTSEMDLAVGDLADRARGHPELVALLTREPGEAASVLARAAELPGGEGFLEALGDFLRRYGMRGPAEIDLARPRWRDDPGSLLAMVAGSLLHERAGAHHARHAALAEAGSRAAERLVRAARSGPWGLVRGPVVARLTRVARILPAVREHPKFLLVRVFDLVRPSILAAGDALAASGRLEHAGDVWTLTLPELQAALEDPDAPLRERVAGRRADALRFARMEPPRLMTSEGEIPVLTQDAQGAPEGALLGSAVSPGVVEGVARVVLDPARAALRPGEILIAPFTDPGWTPLFTQAAGLVMEVGGLMTHGSVVAREYGLPAVVGVQHATTRIRTGQRVRVHGGAGYVELLDDGAAAADERPDEGAAAGRIAEREAAAREGQEGAGPSTGRPPSDASG